MHVSLKNNNRCHSKLAQLLVSLQENRTLSPAPATRVSDPLSLWDENSKNRLLGTCLCSHFTLGRPCPYFFSSLTPIVIPRGSSATEPSHFLVSLRLVLLPSMGLPRWQMQTLWGEARGREESPEPSRVRQPPWQPWTTAALWYCLLLLY